MIPEWVQQLSSWEWLFIVYALAAIGCAASMISPWVRTRAATEERKIFDRPKIVHRSDALDTHRSSNLRSR